MIAWILLTIVAAVAFVAYRVSRCPVFRTLGLGMGSWRARCEERPSRDDAPTYHPHDPFPPFEPETVHAARRVA